MHLGRCGGNRPHPARGWDTGELRQQAVAEAAANDLLSAADGVNGLQIRAALDLICDLASGLAVGDGSILAD